MKAEAQEVHGSLMVMLMRVRRALPRFMPFAGFVMFLSGILGLVFTAPSILNQSQDLRRAAQETDLEVVLSTSPESGVGIVHSPERTIPSTVALQLNTRDLEVGSLQLVFNVALSGGFAEAPTIEVNSQSGLAAESIEVQEVADGYIVAVKAEPACASCSLSSSAPVTVVTISFIPEASGTLNMFFDTEKSVALVGVDSTDVMVNKLVPPGTFTYPIALNDQGDAQTPVEWKTTDVSLKADDFYIEANGKTYRPNSVFSRLTSDPTRGPTDDYTTLEVEWDAGGGILMGMNMYIYRTGSTWTVDEMRSYNGNPTPWDWIEHTNPVMVGGQDAGKRISAPIGKEYINTGEAIFTSSQNGVGKIYFKNLRMGAFLPQDDLRFDLAKTDTIFYSNDGKLTPVAATQLKTGTTYQAQVKYQLQNTLKKEVPAGDITTRAMINDVSTTQVDSPLSYNLVSSHADGAGSTFGNIVFTAQENNKLVLTIDPQNFYAETNESNNALTIHYSATGTEQVGGTTSVSCNEVCSSNSQCPVNQRCYLINNEGRCRLATNPSSTSCQVAAAGTKQCNQTCTSSSDCVTGLSCSTGVCRNPQNSTSTSCAQLTKGQEEEVASSCNQACTTSKDCAANLSCYQGACRLVTNKSSTTCSPTTAATITDPDTGADELDDVDDATDSGYVAVDTAPKPTPSPVPENESALDTLQRLFTTSANGRLPLLVMLTGLGLVAISLILFLLRSSRSKHKAMMPPAKAPAKPPAQGAPPTPGALYTQPSSTPPLQRPPVTAPIPERPITPPTQIASQDTAVPPSTLTQGPNANSMMARVRDKGIKPPGQS